LIATYPSAGQWHTAATILRRGDVVAQMADPREDDPSIGLLVAPAEADLARQLLFSPQPLPQQTPGLSETQERDYTVAIYFFRFLLIVLVLIVVAATWFGLPR
jgi:hypothetical protein